MARLGGRSRDIGSHEGAPYIVTELLEGETLHARLAASALSPRKATDYAIQPTCWPPRMRRGSSIAT